MSRSWQCRPGAVGQNVTFHGEPASLVVGEANALGAVRRTKDAVLFQQIINDLLLLSIDPAGDEKQEKGKRGWRRIHWESLPESWVGSKNGVWTFACAKIHQGTVYADVGVFRRFLEALAEFSHRTRSTSSLARPDDCARAARLRARDPYVDTRASRRKRPSMRSPSALRSTALRRAPAITRAVTVHRRDTTRHDDAQPFVRTQSVTIRVVSA